VRFPELGKMNSLKDQPNSIRVVPYVGLKGGRGMVLLRPMNSLKDQPNSIRVVPYVGLKGGRGIVVLRPVFGARERII